MRIGPWALVVAAGLLTALAGAAPAQPASAWRDSLRARPRLGERSYLDSQAGPATDAESLFAPPEAGLAFEQLRLQEILREHLLREEENARRVPVFAADTLLALDLYQLRGEEYPHRYPASDVWIYIWRGRGQLQRAEGESAYGPGELLQIPAGQTYSLHNESGAPTVALLWQRPPIDDRLTEEFIPAELQAQMRLDSLRGRLPGTGSNPQPPR
jgi:mannose-6-phosphate isomerase-like protein (cupin superfamily)